MVYMVLKADAFGADSVDPIRCGELIVHREKLGMAMV
jgi:hypothetical protein